MENEKFIVHGTMQTSNFGGWEIMLSDCGSAAKIRDNYGQDIDKLLDSETDWIEIEYMKIPEDNEEELEAVIKYNDNIIPLNQVIRV
jgi:N-acetylglucosamine kinase-like BadF-type ATPase